MSSDTLTGTAAAPMYDGCDDWSETSSTYASEDSLSNQQTTCSFSSSEALSDGQSLRLLNGGQKFVSSSCGSRSSLVVMKSLRLLQPFTCQQQRSGLEKWNEEECRAVRALKIDAVNGAEDAPHLLAFPDTPAKFTVHVQTGPVPGGHFTEQDVWPLPPGYEISQTPWHCQADVEQQSALIPGCTKQSLGSAMHTGKMHDGPRRARGIPTPPLQKGDPIPRNLQSSQDKQPSGLDSQTEHTAARQQQSLAPPKSGRQANASQRQELTGYTYTNHDNEEQCGSGRPTLQHSNKASAAEGESLEFSLDMRPFLPTKRCSKDGVWHIIRYPDQLGSELLASLPSSDSNGSSPEQSYSVGAVPSLDHLQRTFPPISLMDAEVQAGGAHSLVALDRQEKKRFAEHGCQAALQRPDNPCPYQVPTSGRAWIQRTTACASTACTNRGCQADRPPPQRHTTVWEKGLQTDPDPRFKLQQKPPPLHSYRTGEEVAVQYGNSAAQHRRIRSHYEGNNSHISVVDQLVQADCCQDIDFRSEPRDTSRCDIGMQADCSGADQGRSALHISQQPFHTEIHPPVVKQRCGVARNAAAERGVQRAKAFVERLERKPETYKPTQGQQIPAWGPAPTPSHRYMRSIGRKEGPASPSMPARPRSAYWAIVKPLPRCRGSSGYGLRPHQKPWNSRPWEGKPKGKPQKPVWKPKKEWDSTPLRPQERQALRRPLLTGPDRRDVRQLHSSGINQSASKTPHQSRPSRGKERQAEYDLENQTKKPAIHSHNNQAALRSPGLQKPPHTQQNCQARGVKLPQQQVQHRKKQPATACLDGTELKACQKAARLLLARRQEEIAVGLSSGSYTVKRIAAARKRRFQAELKDIRDTLLNVKQLTNALTSFQ